MKSVINRLSMVILMEHNLEQAVSFYEKLGIPLVFHLPNRWAEFEIAGVKLGLCPIPEQREDTRTGFVFEVEDVKKLYNQLKDTVAFVSEPIEKVHGLMVSIKDPGGNIIDLYQPTHEKIETLVREAKEGGQA